jgi:hypothetical protein
LTKSPTSVAGDICLTLLPVPLTPL